MWFVAKPSLLLPPAQVTFNLHIVARHDGHHRSTLKWGWFINTLKWGWFIHPHFKGPGRPSWVVLHKLCMHVTNVGGPQRACMVINFKPLSGVLKGLNIPRAMSIPWICKTLRWWFVAGLHCRKFPGFLEISSGISTEMSIQWKFPEGET